MSETMVLKASVRDQSGTRSSVALRQQGKLPAVVYGHKKEPVSIALETKAFLDLLHHGSRIFEVDLAGEKDTLLVKDLQYNYHLVLHPCYVIVNLYKDEIQLLIRL